MVFIVDYAIVWRPCGFVPPAFGGPAAPLSSGYPD